VHRDFKPDNVMVAQAGYVKVLDFGLAKLRADAILAQADGQPTRHTAPGIILGTVGYMSPEQAEGRSADPRSDIFSFGCVLYELATGVRAFAGRSSVDTLHRIIHVDPDPVSTHAPAASPELQRIIRKCLAKDPEARYQSIKDVAIDLSDLRRQLDSSAAAPVSAAQVPAARRPQWLVPIAAAIDLAAVLGWLGVGSPGGKAARRP
jgi:serine/threonine protein kinase